MSQPSCAGSIFLCHTRLALLDTNGVPLPGAGNLVNTDQGISLAFEAEISEGADIERKNGCGVIKIARKQRDKLKRLNLTLQLTYPDPEITYLLLGGTTITSAGNVIGWLSPEVGDQPDRYVSLEAWTERADGGGQMTDYPYWRWIFPKVQWQISSRTAEEDPMITQFTGQASENDNWYNGPGNDWPHASNRLMGQRMETSIPAASCGAQSLAAS